MANVISYRTDKEEQLKKFAKQRSITLSQLTSDIVNHYLEFYELSTKLDMVRDTKKTISVCFELLDDDDLTKIGEIDTVEVIQSFKMMINDFSFEKLSELVRSWFRFSNYDLEEFDEDTHVKFVSKNKMSRNWNFHQANVFVQIYQHFGFSGSVESTEENLLVFKISKKQEQK